LRSVVVLLDARRTPDERDIRLLEWLRQYDIPVICALTKADKLKRQESERARRDVQEQVGLPGLLLTSAKGGQGIRELWAEIGKRLG
jgi:GTP-binding protein